VRVLRFLWQRVLAFDRLGSRSPQLIQIWLMAFFVVMPLTFAFPAPTSAGRVLLLSEP
jgi:hypothetical protein